MLKRIILDNMSDTISNNGFNITKLIIDQRKQLKLSLRELSQLTKYSYQTLSKYETGGIELNKNNRVVLFEHLHINADDVDYLSNDFKQDLDLLFESIVYDEQAEISSLFSRIKKAEEYLDYTKFREEFITLKIIVSIINNESISQEMLNESQFNSFKLSLQQWIYDYIAIYYLKNNDLIRAVKYIDKAISLGVHESNVGLVNYHAGIIYSVYGQLLKARHYLETAETHFIKQRNNIRLINLQIQLTTVESKLGQVNKARASYLRLLKDIEKINDHYSLNVVYHNLSWLEYRQENFQVSLDYLDKLEKSQTLDENDLITKMLCLTELEQFDESDSIYKNNTILDTMYKLYSEIIHLENIHKIDKNYEAKCMELYHIIKDKRDFENVEIVIFKLLDYYEMNRLYKSAYELTKELYSYIDWVYQLD